MPRVKVDRNQQRVERAVRTIDAIGPKRYGITDEEADSLINAVICVFTDACLRAGIPPRSVTAIRTKFRDAGRRSAPWRAVSSRVPGRPQDGSDGNRINRWLMPPDHKYYATKIDATLVEVKYYLQALSLAGAPSTDETAALAQFHPWLIENPVAPGEYLDPVQLVPINFIDFANDRRLLQSGHLKPLDIGGKHHPSNTFLMLARSNQLQGNLTVAQLLELLRSIISKHDELQADADDLERRIQEND